MDTKFEIDNSPADVWRHRPMLAIHIAHISQIWNLLDLRLAGIFSVLSRSDRAAIAAMFISIASLSTKLTMLRTMSADILSVDSQKELERLCRRVSKLSRYRTAIIHGIWAVNDEKLDSIFLIANFYMPRRVKEEYKANDFKRIEAALNSLLVDLQNFHMQLHGINP